MNRIEAEEHLRVIRSLMEKATIYRAISAPTALAGGVASTIAGGTIFARWRPVPVGGSEREVFEWWFLAGWCAVLVVTALANTWFLWRDARRRGDSFISSGMRHALAAMMPAMLCGAGLSVLAVSWGVRVVLPPVWMLCYALALLATRGFAPLSIQRLGWTFFIAGFVSLLVLARTDLLAGWGGGGWGIPAVANFLMVATFGFFHLIYAAFTWPRGGSKAGAN